MRLPRMARGARLCVAIGLLAGAVGLASAARFSLSLTRVHLGSSHPVETVALGNEEAQALDFEVRVKRWTQGPDGAWSLVPSDDLIVHPLVFTVAAGGQARLRIGTLSPTVAAERAYRVELQQLPDPNAPRDAMQVRMLTKVSLPVFVLPRDAKPRLSLAVTTAQPARLVLALRNAGTAYAPPGEGAVRVLDGAGRVVHQGRLTLGYVLAGAQLPVSTAWPAGACRRAASVELTTVDGGTLRAGIPAHLRPCAP